MLVDYIEHCTVSTQCVPYRYVYTARCLHNVSHIDMYTLSGYFVFNETVEYVSSTRQREEPVLAIL